MPEIRRVAFVCPAEYDPSADILTSVGKAQAGVVAAELRRGLRFIDPVVLATRGSGADTSTADFLGGELAAESWVRLGSPAIEELNEHPESWAGDIRGRLEAAIVGEPAYDPPVDHIGNIVAVVSPRAIAAVMGLVDAGGIRPEQAFYPDLSPAA